MTREERDMGPDVSRDEELAGEVALREQAEARAEVERGDVRAIQRRLVRMFGSAATIPAPDTPITRGNAA